MRRWYFTKPARLVASARVSSQLSIGESPAFWAGFVICGGRVCIVLPLRPSLQGPKEPLSCDVITC
jgi:hypothetical protein